VIVRVFEFEMLHSLAQVSENSVGL